VVFLASDEFAAHEARICISQGGLLDDARREKHYCAEQYLKSSDEMNALVAHLAYGSCVVRLNKIYLQM
jgi:DNA polymerase-3 subunit alpha